MKRYGIKQDDKQKQKVSLSFGSTVYLVGLFLAWGMGFEKYVLTSNTVLKFLFFIFGTFVLSLLSWFTVGLYLMEVLMK